MTHGLLLCDKPRGCSSHQLVALVRKAFGTAKVGHAGTLDPMATGLLVVAIGEGLKVLRYLTLDDKSYRATLRLGAETDTLDADGVVTNTAALPDALDRGSVEAACASFLGETDQLPPVVSAIKQGGVPLYRRARRGEQVEVAPRRVIVHSIGVEAVRRDHIQLRIDCGKGFYVRSLARDLARALGTVGHLSELRRLRSGTFDVAGAVEAERLREVVLDPSLRAGLRRYVVPLDRALATCPSFVLDAAGAEHARQGRPLALAHVVAGLPEGGIDACAALEPVLLRCEARVPLALARCADGMLTIVRGLRLPAAAEMSPPLPGPLL